MITVRTVCPKDIIYSTEEKHVKKVYSLIDAALLDLNQIPDASIKTQTFPHIMNIFLSQAI